MLILGLSSILDKIFLVSQVSEMVFMVCLFFYSNTILKFLKCKISIYVFFVVDSCSWFIIVVTFWLFLQGVWNIISASPIKWDWTKTRCVCIVDIWLWFRCCFPQFISSISLSQSWSASKPRYLCHLIVNHRHHHHYPHHHHYFSCHRHHHYHNDDHHHIWIKEIVWPRHLVRQISLATVCALINYKINFYKFIL